jgi:TonB-dependent starch-binding outer membrane protein SusC
MKIISPISFIIILYIILLSVKMTFGQQNEKSFIIKGFVSDYSTNEKLIGVNVFIKGTTTGTVTDVDGSYSLKIPEGKNTLVFSFVGYKTQEAELKLSADRVLNIHLEVNEELLGEVKITSQRKFFGNMNYGRELPSIGAGLISKQNSNNASDLLHARVAGVWSTKTSGAPGDQEKIRIRGQASFFSSAEPLYVVDGVPVPIVNMSSLGIADLNIHDIENVTVLKDASATSLYGYQGGNGVVLIETKKGSVNQISFSTKFGVQKFDHFYDLMNTKEQLTALDSAYSKLSLSLKNLYPVYSDTLSDHNRQDEIFSTGFIQEYQLSASGSARKLKYYLSGNYTDHAGILPNSEYKRYTLYSKFGRTFGNKFAIDLSYRGSFQENKNNQDIYMGNRLLFEGINKSPCLESTPDSLLYYKGENTRRIFNSGYVQLNQPELLESIINNNHHELDITTHALNLSARYQLNSHISLNALSSLMYRHSSYDLTYRYFYYLTSGASVSDIKLDSREEVILINHQFNVSYNNTFNDHNVELVMAYRFYEDNLWWRVDTVQGALNNYSYLRNSMAAYGVNGSVLRLMGSYVANASYNYREKYFVSLVANVSRVKEGLHTDYYTVFPSVAVSWDLKKENFLANVGWINNIKPYANWGKSGNYPLNGLANDLYSEVKNTYGTEGSGTYNAVSQLANHYLKHEGTTEFDYGVASSFFDKRLNISVVRYNKKIDNIIVKRDIPEYYGGGNQYLNVGKIGVNGTELGIEATPVRQKSFTWFFNLNFSSSKQTIKKLLNGDEMAFTYNDILVPNFIIKEGKEFGDFYGYKYLGKWTRDDTKKKDNRYVKSNGMKFLNADSTNQKLDANDMVVTGNSIPDFTINFSNTFEYKNFSIDMQWYAVLGVDKYNATRAATIMAVTNNDVNAYIADTISGIRYDAFYKSSEFVEDASFIRLKTLTFNYEPSKAYFGHAKLRFSLSFENLVTITRYRGYDPEATTFTDNNFSDNALDRGAVPNPKAVYATIGITY